LALLEAREIVMRFGGVVALGGASLAVEQGRVAGLIGPNGAGKTTLFNVVSGLLAPTSGAVLLDGEDVTGLSVHGRAQRGVARTFQRLEVFGSLSVRENVLVSAEIHRSWGTDVEDPRRTTDRLLDLVGLRGFADHPANAVPTGIARLTELARALATNPRVLLLDEPSSGLNETETETLGDLLVELAGQGRGVLMVEHDVDLVMRVCEWIDVLDFGQIIASGPPADVRADPAVQAAYLGGAAA
jgi:branched-chain amino acid transport system ATP-binding protein